MLLKETAGRGGGTPGNLRRSTGCRQHGGDVLSATAGDGHLFLPVKGRAGVIGITITQFVRICINTRLELSDLLFIHTVAA
jgi:hypothetical protein